MEDDSIHDEVVVEDVTEDLGRTEPDDGEEIAEELDEGDLDELVMTVTDYNVGPIVGADDGTE